MLTAQRSHEDDHDCQQHQDIVSSVVVASHERDPKGFSHVFQVKEIGHRVQTRRFFPFDDFGFADAPVFFDSGLTVFDNYQTVNKAQQV